MVAAALGGAVAAPEAGNVRRTAGVELAGRAEPSRARPAPSASPGPPRGTQMLLQLATGSYPATGSQQRTCATVCLRRAEALAAPS